MEVMKTTKLTKYYGKVRGIKELDLTVTHGEFFGFIGPNGAINLVQDTTKSQHFLPCNLHSNEFPLW